MNPIPAMMLDKVVDDMKRRCIDHRDLMDDPVGVLMEVAKDMKAEFAKVNWTNRVVLGVEELKK